MRAIGVCLGASSVSVALIEKVVSRQGLEAVKLLKADSRPHDGNISTVMQEMIQELQMEQAARIAITGRKFRNTCSLPSISEAEAIELAYGQLKYKYPECDGIVSAGGENFMAYQLSKIGQVVNVYTGNKCASGTGEFFLQQIKRMNLNIKEALGTAQVDNPYPVAGRCSVFCKSDCTHALNKGQGKGAVVAGLCRMMAFKILELLNKCPARRILFIGGAATNTVMLQHIKKELGGTRELYVADEAKYFEAFGAAVWSLEHGASAYDINYQQGETKSVFTFLPALKGYTDRVVFKSVEHDSAKSGDQCIVGLDVGSTTTKAVVVRLEDNAILASVYLRTNGDPVGAARQCYQKLARDLHVQVSIQGIGVTGSGRQIAGLHADTDGVINEIIAHATAAIYFDPEVDTIFEIGGQDAKYTYITNKVPSDYAMNEACSAGTGSFLEEAAAESMGISTLEIADIALSSNRPPNFNDQCAAFIGSDIKNAIQEGIQQEDIVGGLVYSICQNYVNRVKGNRVVGKKIFMQGGVCYNRAVPLAMAALVGKEIIVPPEPGLMGAFGVALELKNKFALKLLVPKSFDLNKLAQREVTYAEPFICNGGQEKCDRKCMVNIIEIEQKKYPFGGACNKYVNIRRNLSYDVESLDLVTLRERLVFEKYAQKAAHKPGARKIGIPKSLMVNSLYPLYFNYFTALGLEVVLGDCIDIDGIERKGASFCYPVELAHGLMGGLLRQELDYIFLPQVRGMRVENGIDASVTCPLVQGEPYYLRSAFKELANKSIISPILDFSEGYQLMGETFAKIGKTLGFSKKDSLKAFEGAIVQQQACLAEMKAIGRQIIRNLEQNPAQTAIVLFGRSYNAFTKDANMGIPGKFASRGYLILPWEFLTFDQEEPVHRMFWSTGQMMLKAARVVKKHPRLFAAYVTNFSCGPDSFLLSYFRDIMEEKPSLTLELDSHSADAGIDTRIEAFLDVVTGYLELQKQVVERPVVEMQPKAVLSFVGGKVYITDLKGEKHSLTDKDVQVIVPSMGDLGSRLLAASLRNIGVNASHMQPPAERELQIGRANSSCKECLPFTLVAGSILHDASKRSKDELLVYFLADSSGPCRFGQYYVLMENLIHKNELGNVAVMPLTSNNGYAGLGTIFQLRAWIALVIAEVMEEIYGALLVLAKDRVDALACYEQSVQRIEEAVACKSWKEIQQVLAVEAQYFLMIARNGTLHDTMKVAMVGEIYVRLDSFARQSLVEKLADKGIITKVAPVTEFVYFCDYLIQKDIHHIKVPSTTRISSVIKGYFKQHYERVIKQTLAKSGLYELHMINIASMVDKVKHLIPPEFTAGDTVLTVGAALTEIVDEVSGVISIGPFGCMPCRVSEAIIGETINDEKPKITEDARMIEHVMQKHPALPFLSIESDGNPFPQVIEAKFEIFCMQVARVHQAIMESRHSKKNA